MNTTTTTTTINITADDLEDELIGLLDEVDVRTDYSGRGMYGATCFGLVVDKTDLLVGLALGQVLEGLGEDAFEVLSNARTDNMGYDTIIYFPGYNLAE
jgi:hypothetical protein